MHVLIALLAAALLALSASACSAFDAKVGPLRTEDAEACEPAQEPDAGGEYGGEAPLDASACADR